MEKVYAKAILTDKSKCFAFSIRDKDVKTRYNNQRNCFTDEL